MAELIQKARDGTLEDVSDSGAVVSVISLDDVQKEECLVLVPAEEHALAQDSPASNFITGASIVENIRDCAGPAITVTEHLADTPPVAQPETEDKLLFPEADPSPHAEKDVVNTSSRSSKAWFPAKLAGLVRRVSARITAVSTSILRAVRLRKVRDDEH
ncbi:hypothetical protein POSPLADRAFT_1040254 [Postia placenta MAD-698-R-SB12]|uniref:Uncharacterized protein n=1 Tax=Postia placenta MAD-698-R-SB12 TaxID=670580 RepID=A0A1X6MWV0_9APHY|nr:hypothetical protein POSPLADRAFT_1040254 [Postia placenta MAD-698-R-SB12]OSX60831.1 hypothetical protein POSPLADRAFT_1040254 [Postia placenta MAD-698-R-SB12]